jgi:subtilase-type serine protease
VAGGLILTGTLQNSNVLNAGYFQNDGLTREMTLSTGTVAGNGNFAGGLVASSGYVVPGDRGQATPGHMTVGTLLAMGRDTTYVVRAVGGDASRIDVNGPAAINGSTFDAMVGSPAQFAAVGQRYTVLTASDGVGGQFGAVTGNLGSVASQYPFLDADLGYTPDSISLDLVRSGIPFVAASQSPNEYGVATGLDTMSPSLPISRAAASLNFASAPGTFNALAGDLHSSLRTDLIQDTYGLGQAAIARLDAAECAGTAPGQVVSYGDGQPAANDGGCHGERRAARIQAYDSWSRNGGANGVSGLLGSSGGFVGGVDALAPGDWRIGGLLGYAHSRFSADSTAASGSADNVSVGAYGGRSWGPIGLKLGAYYTWNMISTTRTVSFPGFWDQAATNYAGGTAQAFADLSYRFALHGLSLEPFGALAYVNQDMASFSESGFDGAALHGDANDMGVTFATLGTRFAKGFTLGQYVLEADAMVGYRRALGSVTPTTSESFLFGGAGFDVSGVPVPRDVALLNLGVRARLSESVKVGLAYVGEYGGSYSQNGVKGNVDWSF